MVFEKKSNGFMMISAALTAIVFILLASSFVGLCSGMLSTLKSGRTASAAQQYAEIDANTLTLLPYDELISVAHGRTNIAGADGWQSEVIIGPEKIIGEENRQRIGAIKIYRQEESAPRASLQVPLSSQGSSAGSMPIGAVITWPLAKDPDGPDKGKWLECDGRVIDAAKYPKLAKLMSYTPNYAGVFLRGYGSQQSSHYGVVMHQSDALGTLQGDAIRNISGSMTNSGSFRLGMWNSGDGCFSKILMGRTALNDSGDWYDYVARGITFNAANVVPTTSENRPVNRAVRYLIRAS